jgi:hypothetical protein
VRWTLRKRSQQRNSLRVVGRTRPTNHPLRVIPRQSAIYAVVRVGRKIVGHVNSSPVTGWGAAGWVTNRSLWRWAASMRRQAMSKYLGSISMPMNERPSLAHATPVVPLPRNGSRTVSPSSVHVVMWSDAKLCGIGAGCPAVSPLYGFATTHQFRRSPSVGILCPCPGFVLPSRCLPLT